MVIERTISDLLKQIGPGGLLEFELIGYAFDKMRRDEMQQQYRGLANENISLFPDKEDMFLNQRGEIESLCEICPKVLDVINDIIEEAREMRISDADQYIRIHMFKKNKIMSLGELEITIPDSKIDAFYQKAFNIVGM